MATSKADCQFPCAAATLSRGRYGLMNGFRMKARSMGIEYNENEVVDVCRDGDRIIGVVLKSGETTVTSPRSCSLN